MMTIKLYALEQDLARIKRLLDAEVMIDALAELLVSKGIATEEEITSATARMKSTEKYDFDVHEVEETIEVFRLMMNTGAKETLRMHGLLNEDGTMKELQDTHDERI